MESPNNGWLFLLFFLQCNNKLAYTNSIINDDDEHGNCGDGRDAQNDVRDDGDDVDDGSDDKWRWNGDNEYNDGFEMVAVERVATRTSKQTKTCSRINK